MSVWHLDTDDEITDAVARLRTATDERVIFVVPPGSRVATGRINFRLLSREAQARERVLAIVSPDAQVRALATSAGLPAHASVADAEAALERGETGPVPEAPPPDEGEDGAAPVAGAAVLFAEDAAAEDAPATGASPSGRRRRRLGAAAGVAVGLVAIGGVAAVTVLPSASVSLVPRTVAIGPVAVALRADPAASTPDPSGGVIPARVVQVPLAVKGTFGASGVQTNETRSRGSVVFTSDREPIQRAISARTRVRTADGREFDTTRSVTLASAPDGSWTASAPVQAVLPGPEGDVAAGAISVQEALASLGISVTNPEPTRGGSRERTAIATQDDYDAAVVDLQSRLAGQLADKLDDPALAPPGVTLFAKTAALGRATFSPPAAEVVGTPVEEFTLDAQATGTVQGVEQTLVAEVAADALEAKLPEGSRLLPGSVQVEPVSGDVQGGAIRVTTSVRGRAWDRVDEAALASAIRGKPVDEARSILADYGEAQLTVWPGFLGSVPDDAGRIAVIVRDPGPAPTRAP